MMENGREEERKRRELRHETMGKYRARVVDAYWMTIIIIKNDENCETEMAAA